MARKAAKHAAEHAAEQTALHDDDELTREEEELYEEAEGASKIDNEIAEILERGEGDVRLMRWNPVDKKWKGLPSMPRAGFSRDLVAEAWGGGKYMMTVWKGNAYKGKKVFEIDDAVKAKQQPLPEHALSHGNGSGQDAALVVLVRGMLEELKAMRTQPVVKENPLDVMQLMKGIAETARSMVPPQPAVAQQSVADQLKVATELVTLGRSIVGEPGEGGGSSSGDLYTAAILKAIDPVIEIVKDRVQQERLASGRGTRVLGPGAAPSAALSAPAAAPAAAPTQEAKVLPPWVLEVQRVMPLIVSRCKRNIDAGATAYFILGDLSDAAQDKLAEFAQRDDYEQQVMQFLPPDLKSNPAWVQEFLNVVREYLLGGEEEIVDEGGGDEPRPSAGAPASPAGAGPSLDEAASRSIDAIPT